MAKKGWGNIIVECGEAKGMRECGQQCQMLVTVRVNQGLTVNPVDLATELYKTLLVGMMSRDYLPGVCLLSCPLGEEPPEHGAQFFHICSGLNSLPHLMVYHTRENCALTASLG